MLSVRTPSPPTRAKCNCDTNAHIKFIFDTAIDDPEWKNPTDFGDNSKTKKADSGHLVQIWWKGLYMP